MFGICLGATQNKYIGFLTKGTRKVLFLRERLGRLGCLRERSTCSFFARLECLERLQRYYETATLD